MTTTQRRGVGVVTGGTAGVGRAVTPDEVEAAHDPHDHNRDHAAGHVHG